MSTQANLPPGCSVNDLPGWRPYHLEPALDECHECGEGDLLNYEQVYYHGKLHCTRCVPHCEVCGENMGDNLRLERGDFVDYGGWHGHASCVADAAFDLDEWMNREVVAAIFAPVEVGQ